MRALREAIPALRIDRARNFQSAWSGPRPQLELSVLGPCAPSQPQRGSGLPAGEFPATSTIGQGPRGRRVPIGERSFPQHYYLSFHFRSSIVVRGVTCGESNGRRTIASYHELPLLPPVVNPFDASFHLTPVLCLDAASCVAMNRTAAFPPAGETGLCPVDGSETRPHMTTRGICTNF